MSVRVIKSERVQTVGLSPKAVNPAITLAALGLLLVIVGLIAKDSTLRTLGYGALGSALPAFGVAHQSSQGDVRVTEAE